MPHPAKARQYTQNPCLFCYPWNLCSEGQGVKGFHGGVKLVIFMPGDKEIEIMDRRLIGGKEGLFKSNPWGWINPDG